MRDWQKITTLPKHAPLNAAYGQPTGYRSFLGGSIWAWADAEGRYLGESNAVPANMCGEKTKPGKEEKPGKIVIDAEEIAKLEGRPLQYWIVRGEPRLSLGQTLSIRLFYSRIGVPPSSTQVFSGPFLDYEEASSRCMLRGIQEGELPHLKCLQEHLEEKWEKAS